MKLWMVLAGVLSACGFPKLADVPEDANDGVIPSRDSSNTDAPTPVCYGNYLKICYDASLPRFTPVLLTGAVVDIDTDKSTLCDQGHDRVGTYCVVAGSAINITTGTRLRAIGSKPLVLLSTGSIELHGTIDVSSATTAGVLGDPKRLGAGSALAATCVNGLLPSAATGNSGGYGGSFGGSGGRGEQLAGGGEQRGEPGLPVSFPPALRGGCPGGAGAAGLVSGAGGEGGSGGGAVAIIASNILIDGDINASGAGGGGGPLRATSGAGGGGSGGMIFLEAVEIIRSASGRLFANGGGGGEGSAGSGPGAGPGQTGKVSLGPTVVGEGAGFPTGTNGGNGGDGSVGDILGGASAPAQASGDGGGGGGGGGAGFIHAPGFSGVATIAPPSTNPSQSK